MISQSFLRIFSSFGGVYPLSYVKNITLFGSGETRYIAKGLLENHPSVKRIDSSDGNTHLRLLLTKPISETELIALLHASGISGMQVHK